MGVIVVRHPPTADPRIISGQSDVPLASQALDVLDGIVAQLPPARRIVSSDLARCRVLGEVVAARWNLPCAYDARWREQSFGVWEGRRWDEVEGRDYLDHWTTATPPGGESIGNVRTRVAEALAAADDETLVITHAGPIRCAISIAHDLPLEQAFAIAVPFGSWRIV